MSQSVFVFEQKRYLTDGGLETDLIYNKGVRLNAFSAFELLAGESGRATLSNYYTPYLELAREHQIGFVMETPTWRANADWGIRLGYTHDELFALNKQAVRFMRELSRPYSSRLPHVVISGNLGPRGDGYRADVRMTAEQAKVYHLEQVKAFAYADADVVTAATITYSDEAIGIIQAASSFGLPAVVSFTVETDGRLPSGETLRQAIERTDRATRFHAEHFMINCAHPHHFIDELQREGDWKLRIGGIRANASMKSHAELDACDTLDAGDKLLLANGYVHLHRLLPSLRVFGGCCGTDHTHLEKILGSLKKNGRVTSMN